MPCTATPRGKTDNLVQWSDWIDNDPCGKPDYAGGLCQFHYQKAYGLTAVSANLFPNPGVETDLAGIWQYYLVSTLTRSNAQAHSGSWSARVVLTGQYGGIRLGGTTSGPPVSSQSEPVLPNTKYMASCWVRCDTATNPMGLTTQESDAAGTAGATLAAYASCAANTWTQIVLPFTTSPTTAFVWFTLQNHDATFSSFYVDDIVLVKL